MRFPTSSCFSSLAIVVLLTGFCVAQSSGLTTYSQGTNGSSQNGSGTYSNGQGVGARASLHINNTFGDTTEFFVQVVISGGNGELGSSMSPLYVSANAEGDATTELLLSSGALTGEDFLFGVIYWGRIVNGDKIYMGSHPYFCWERS